MIVTKTKQSIVNHAEPRIVLDLSLHEAEILLEHLPTPEALYEQNLARFSWMYREFYQRLADVLRGALKDHGARIEASEITEWLSRLDAIEKASRSTSS